MFQRPSRWIDHSRLDIGLVIFIGYLLAAILIGYLVLVADPWVVAANTRLLDVLFRSGVVQLTDADAGYIAGVPDHELFLRSQEPIDWAMVALAAVLLVAAWVLRGLRFHHLARAFGLVGSLGRHLRVFIAGEEVGRYLPYELGAAATYAAVEDTTDAQRTTRLALAHFGARVLEIGVFSLVCIALLGVGIWLQAMLWAGLMLAGAVYLARGRAGWRGIAVGRREVMAAFRAAPTRVLMGLVIGLLAFPLEEISAYLIVQAFTSTYVVLGGATPAHLLLALVAGKTAQLIRITPGGIGQFEWGFAAALVVTGQGLAEAVTITLLFSLVRHLTGAIVLGVTAFRGGSPSSADARQWAYERASSPGGALFTIPSVSAVVGRLLVVGYVLLAFFLLNQVRLLLIDFWLLESLGFQGVFWTNFWTGTALFVLGATLWAGAVIGPAVWNGIRGPQRGFAIRLGMLLGIVSGVLWVGATEKVLLLIHGVPFGETDSVFGHDIGLYMFTLPAIVEVVWGTLLVAVVAFVGSIVWHRRSGHDSEELARPATASIIEAAARRPALALLGLIGILGATRLWLTRYDVLVKDNYSSALPIGAEALDVTGLFSTVNQVWILSLVTLGLTASALWWLTRDAANRPIRRRAAALLFGPWMAIGAVFLKDNYSSALPIGAETLDVTGLFSSGNQVWILGAVVVGFTASAMWWLPRRASDWATGPRAAALLFGPWLAIGTVFVGGVAVRDIVAVTPNEPVVQLPFLDEHIQATNRAWGMDAVELVDFVPNDEGDPLPDIDRVLEHPTVANAQLWPGAVSWLERLLDPQHVDRILLEGEERHPDLVLGASLEIFRQQQKLRPYYDFLDVDVVRYEIDGEPTLVASSVRELPLLEPHPWLAFWGQRFVLFTHGHGLVAAPLGEVSTAGGPVYASSEIPPVAAVPELDPGQHAVYYGEGSRNVGFSNVRNVPELDYPTEQGREDVFLPADVDAGVPVDSFLKRLAFAWGTSDLFDAGSLLDIAFSGLITDETRIHFQRQPLDRVERVAPFLFLDTDPYAVAGPDGIEWMVNGMTTADRYPYAMYADLGDKSVRRGPFPVTTRLVNYVADSVKVTVNAYTGKVAFYRISDEPVVSAWASAYPDLFTDGSQMPAHVEAQRQYPAQLFHTQFDDLWIYYHVGEPLAFFNQEDVFDDGDEVLGAMLDEGSGITFSMEPYGSILETGVDYPASDGGTQFALSQIFTPEGAKNLRAIVTAYQEGDDYGRLAMLQVPKGSFSTGPEQAESIIDQDGEIAEQFGFWNSIGVEVLRGYLTPIVIDGELIYVEPVFIRSVQNPFPQLSRVVVVLRGTATMGETLEEAIRAAYERVGEDRRAFVDDETPP